MTTTSVDVTPQKATPILTTTSSGPVIAGVAAIHDVAHSVGGYGTLGGHGISPSRCSLPGDTTCQTPTSVPPTKDVTGADDYTSGDFATTASGNYRWIAHYDGDTNNNAVDTACNDSDETSTVNPATPDFSIAKDATESSVDHAGAVIHYTIVLHNTGNVDLTGVQVTDPFADPGSLQFVGGDADNDGKLDLTETWTYSATHTVTQPEINAGANLVNTAFGDTDQTGPKNDDATTSVSQNPDFSIAKDATESSVDHAGQVIHYSIVLHNTGNVDLTGVSVTDPFADPGSLQFVGGDEQQRHPGADRDVDV